MKKTLIALARSLAQSVTRRTALKKLGVGASEALAGALKLRQERHVYSQNASQHQAPSGAASLARRDGRPLMPLLTELEKGVCVGVSINMALLTELFANPAVKQK